MPIRVECPECGKSYRVADERAGRAMQCKECGADIEIPRGRRRGGKQRDKGSGVAIGVLIGGAVAGVTAIGVVAFLFVGRAQQPAAPVAAPVNNPPPVAAAPAAPPVVANPPNGVGNPAENPVAPIANAPAAPPTASVPNAPLPPSAVNPATPPNANVAAPASGFKTAAANFEPAFKPVQNWKVEVDPASEASEVDSATKFNVKTVAGYLSEEHVLYPETPSPFALVGSNSTDKEFREVWNLATGTKGSQLRGPRITGRTIGVSPDAKYVAWFRFDGGGGIEVYDIPAKKTLGTLALQVQKFNVAATVLPTSTRLVALSDVNHAIITWKLPSGEIDRQIDLGDKARPGDRRAFSPGGRFVAILGEFLQKAIHIYDLDSGERAGAIEPTKGSWTTLIGMAFSRDGKLFAAAYGDSAGQGERVAIWNVADGSLVEEFLLPNPDQRKNNLSSSRTSLQWFPNTRRLLLNGMYVIDRDSKSVVFAFPKPTLDVDTQTARRVLSDSTIVAWEGTKQSATLAPLELKADDIARAQEVAAAGGLMFDAKLPKLTAFDRGKAADRTAITADWKAAPDPGPSGANLADAVPLKSGNGRLREIECSRPDAGIVCVRLAEEDDSPQMLTAGLLPRAHMISRPPLLARIRNRMPPVPCRQNWLELYDVVKKQPAGRIDIDFPCELMSVSPDGSRVLVQAVEGEGRLDVFGADGKHIAGCRPFQNEPAKEQREIASAALLDANTVAACSLDDRLIVFRLPACEPIYSVDDAGMLAVSPGGKLLATCAGHKIELRDPLTGDGRGSLTLSSVVQALAFSPQGDRLAALTSGRKGNELVVIDLANGSPTNIAVPQATAPMIWCGDQEVLLNRPYSKDLLQAGPTGVKVHRAWMLVDLARKAVLWSYVADAHEVAFNETTFDGRVWLAGPTGKANARQIAAVTLPEPAAKKNLSDQKLEAQAVVRPGLAVSVQFNVNDPPGVADFAQKARKLIDGAVQDNGLMLKEGEPLRLVVSIAPAAANGTITLKALGVGAGTKPDISVQRKAAALRVAYELNGKPVWESKHELTNDFLGITRLPDGKDAQAVLDENMWERALSMLEQNLPPSHVFSDDSARGLGTSRLTGTGPVPLGR